jgi:hypothetical protein
MLMRIGLVIRRIEDPGFFLWELGKVKSRKLFPDQALKPNTALWRQ